eukprot:TRINITY_DN343_c0_g1_i3.p2 TRINITY_DN343_c0_g1~~TRINITY_DN343_c0_g1_i3.p2  ORF type:complete len:142 (-),score=81.37 TRINITY_DN343_c0_g1_i3:30-410(-)
MCIRDSAKSAQEAIKEMEGYRIYDAQLSVAYKQERKKGGSRGPTPADICYNCGKAGHWANECREGNQRGYIPRKYNRNNNRQRYSSRSNSKSSSRNYKRRARDNSCLLYTSPSPRDKRQSRMPSSA